MKKDNTITFRISNELKNNLVKKANESNMSLSRYITLLLSSEIKEQYYKEER